MLLRKQGTSKATLFVTIFVVGILLLSFRKPRGHRCGPLSTESYCPQPHQCVDSNPENQHPRPLIVVSAGAQRSASTFLYNALRILLRIRDPNTVSGWYVDLKHLYQVYAQKMPRNGSNVADISAGNPLQAFQSVGSLLVKIHTVRDWHDFLGGNEIEPEMENVVDAVYTSHRDMRDAVRSIRDMGWGVKVSPSEMAEADYCRRVPRRRRPRQFFRREDYALDDTWVTVAKTQIVCREVLIEAAGSKLRLDVNAEDVQSMDERETVALLQEMSRDLDYAYSNAELELAAKELRRLRPGRCDGGFDVEMSVNPVTHLHKGHVRRGDDEEAKKGRLAIERDEVCRSWLERHLYDVS